ncbi:MAG: hypothetical protein ACHREM_10235 [Polyangiales bacterium]
MTTLHVHSRAAIGEPGTGPMTNIDTGPDIPTTRPPPDTQRELLMPAVVDAGAPTLRSTQPRPPQATSSAAESRAELVAKTDETAEVNFVQPESWRTT